MPVMVSAISRSSSNAGTTTATRLPSSIRPVRLQGRAAGEPARERLPQERGGDAEQEPEEGAHDRRVPLAAGSRLRADGARQDAAALDALRLRQERPRREEVLRHDRPALLGDADDPDRGQLLGPGERAEQRLLLRQALVERGELLLVRLHLCVQGRDLRVHVLVGDRLHDDAGELVRGLAGLARRRRLHGDREERVRHALGRRAARGGSRRDGQLARPQADVARDPLPRRLGGDDLPHRARVRLHARQDPAADRERRPQADDGLRAVRAPAAEGDQVADDRAEDEAEERQPPACRHRGPVAAEVDLVFGELGRDWSGAPPRGFALDAHPAATLAEAQDQCSRNPSSSRTRGAQPRSARIRDTSAEVRRTSPAAGGPWRTSSSRPEIRSSVAIAPRIVASSPPPTLYVPPGGARSIAAIVAATASETYVKLRDCDPSPYSSNGVPAASASITRASAMSGRCLGP